MPRPKSDSVLSIPQLEKMLQKRRMQLSKLSRRRDRLEKQLDALNHQISRLGKEDGHVGSGRRTGRRARNKESLRDALAKLLKEAGRPMKVNDIASAVKAAGYKSTSPAFRGIVNQTLIKDPRFVAAERGLYQLKK